MNDYFRDIGKSRLQFQKLFLINGITPPTIYAGIRELKRKPSRKKSSQRIRKRGGGTKTLLSKQPGISKELESLTAPATKGDPMSPLRWVSKSL